MYICARVRNATCCEVLPTIDACLGESVLSGCCDTLSVIYENVGPPIVHWLLWTFVRKVYIAGHVITREVEIHLFLYKVSAS